jgi:arylsulfatase A-like enzyme
MTGQAPARTHITYWTRDKDRDTSAGHPFIKSPAWRLNGLQKGDLTLPGLLSDAGYTTIHVGKAHFGTVGSSGNDPTNLGFDINIAGHGLGGPGSFYGTQNFSSSMRNGGEYKKAEWDVPGLEKYHGKDIYLTEALAIETKAALRKNSETGKPFYMNFSPYAVHAPIMINKRYADNYPDLTGPEKAYATMIETYDAALGEIVDELKEMGELDNTIFLFTGDNGGLSAHARGGVRHTHNYPLRSGKGSAYEGGVRVPTMIAIPGVTDKASRNATPIISHDYFPTILDWAGVDSPEGHKVDGLSLQGLVKGTKSARFERPLTWHMPHFWGVAGPGIQPYSAIREGDWKLIYNHSDQGFELYNLKNDIFENSNLLHLQPQRAAELSRSLRRQLLAAGAQMPTLKATGDTVPLPRFDP